MKIAIHQMFNRERIGRLALAAATALVSFSSAGAATDTWVAGSGNWSDTGNWSGGVPSNGDTVLIGQTDGVSRTINYDYTGPEQEIELIVSLDGAAGTSADTLSMSANTLTAFDPIFGNNGNGAMNLSGGTFYAEGRLMLGVMPGSNGWFTLSGAGTLSNDAGGEAIGGYGTATFVQTGGTNTMSNTGLSLAGNVGTGYYILSGAGSLLSTTTETTGDAGTGTFTQNDGTNNVSSEFNVGFSNGGNGTFNLNGGTLTVAGIEYISAFNGSTGTFNQTGGTHTDTAEPIVLAGIAATTGVYTITGGSASAPSMDMGAFGGLIGGTGVLNVGGTGVLTIAGTLSVASGSSNVNVSDGTLSATALDLDATYNQNGGTATFSQITGSGSASVTGGKMTLGLGGSPSELGSLTVGGTGTLNVQLGGDTQGVTYDLLNVDNTASLGGTLDVDLVNGFVPNLGEQFIVLTAGDGVAGAFANLVSDDPGLTYTVDYGTGNNLVEITITSVPEPAGIAVLALSGILLRQRTARNDSITSF